MKVFCYKLIVLHFGGLSSALKFFKTYSYSSKIMGLCNDITIYLSLLHLFIFLKLEIQFKISDTIK